MQRATDYASETGLLFVTVNAVNPNLRRREQRDYESSAEQKA
jgi:hypothetical protein